MNNLIKAQEDAIKSICSLRKTATTHARHGRLPRSVKPIFRRYREQAMAFDFSASAIVEQLHDIIDLVVLHDLMDEDDE